MALSILNDLLNYDKLEDGALLIEPKRVAALPFILKSAEALNLQVKEKGLILTFDLDDAHSCTAPNFGINSESYETKLYGLSNESSWGVRSCCLSSADVINVDTHKMNQVIGNLVSNAIKFTPAGRSIIVRARKVVPDQQYGSSTRSTSVVGKANHDDSLDRASSFIRSFYYQIFCCASELETDFQSDVRAGRYTDSHRLRESPAQSASSSSGYLVLEVIDSGVGMASEDSKRLFKEIVQFNPSKLQVNTSGRIYFTFTALYTNGGNTSYTCTAILFYPLSFSTLLNSALFSSLPSCY